MRALCVLSVWIVACGATQNAPALRAPVPAVFRAPSLVPVSAPATVGIHPGVMDVKTSKMVLNTCGNPQDANASKESLFVIVPKLVISDGPQGNDGCPFSMACMSPAPYTETCDKIVSGPDSARVDCSAQFGWTEQFRVYGITRTMYLSGDLSRPQSYSQEINWTDSMGDNPGSCRVMYDLTF